MLYPLVSEIAYKDPLTVFSLFKNDTGSIFFDSAQQRKGCGRYSYIAIEPFLTLTSKNNALFRNNEISNDDPFEALSDELNKFQFQTIQDLPDFQGGAAGYFGYELFQHLEHIPLARLDDIKFPDMVIGFYDLVIGFDTTIEKSWIFSSGFPALDNEKRITRARQRTNSLLMKLEKSHTLSTASSITCNKENILSNFSRNDYVLTAKKVIDYILSGDIFEANLSQRFSTILPDGLKPFDLYQRLRKINPAPFAAYLNFSDIVLASASPERFIKLTSGLVETRPIKGTRPRGKSKQEDERLANELSLSEKDHAENVMIVDLLRNDLSRVCESHSVHVSQLCGLESYATVHHLVSIIHGKLCQNLTAIDLLKASFPGGSITGAPKIRAMEIISELEPTQRGPYCGSIGYIGFNGDMDSSITIRTFCIKNNIVTFQVGGAIVMDSNPNEEYEETLTKALALFKALTLTCHLE